MTDEEVKRVKKLNKEYRRLSTNIDKLKNKKDSLLTEILSLQKKCNHKFGSNYICKICGETTEY